MKKFKVSGVNEVSTVYHGHVSRKMKEIMMTLSYNFHLPIPGIPFFFGREIELVDKDT